MHYDNKTTAAYRCRLRMRRTYLNADAYKNKYSTCITDKCSLCNSTTAIMDAKHILTECIETKKGRDKCIKQLANIGINIQQNDELLRICLGEINTNITTNKHKQQQIYKYTGNYIQYIATITHI